MKKKVKIVLAFTLNLLTVSKIISKSYLFYFSVTIFLISTKQKQLLDKHHASQKDTVSYTLATHHSLCYTLTQNSHRFEIKKIGLFTHFMMKCVYENVWMKESMTDLFYPQGRKTLEILSSSNPLGCPRICLQVFKSFPYK